MKTRGFKEVYQIDGGIFTYGKEYGDDGLWEGALYTFDNRMSIEFSDKKNVMLQQIAITIARNHHVTH
jgi:UPF0176 protein